MDFAVIGVLGSLLAGIGSIYAIRISRRKVEAEVESVQVTTSDKVVNMVMRQLAYMEEEVTKLQTNLAEYRAQVEKLAKNELILSRRITILEDYIRRHGLELPAT